MWKVNNINRMDRRQRDLEYIDRNESVCQNAMINYLIDPQGWN